MVIKDIAALTRVKQRAIIINYNTRNVTFLSLLAALRYADVPILLIDCESSDGSFDFFNTVMQKYKFDLLSTKLNSHGLTLDWIFSKIRDEQILLIDSDLEIVDKKIIDFLNEYIDYPEIFGCSFLVGPKLMTDAVVSGTDFENALLYERPFMPIALFKVSFIKEALDAGRSFAAIMIDNEYAAIPLKLTKITRKLSQIIKLDSPLYFRKRYFSSYPKRVYYDTGAKIYEYLRHQRFLSFASLPRPSVERYVNHFHGATRRIVNPMDTQISELYGNMNEIVLARLRKEYNAIEFLTE
jgi:hypothetical protein